MINTTKRSKAIGLLLRILKSNFRNVGIIGDRYYGYNRTGAFYWLLRRDWQSDFHFPGISCTKTRITTRTLVKLLDNKYFQEHG